MKVYDLYYVTDHPKFFRGELTEEQMDKFWNSLPVWQKAHILIQVKEREVQEKDDRDER